MESAACATAITGINEFACLPRKADSNFETREDVSLFVLLAVLSEGKKVEDAEKSLLTEIKKLQDTPVSAAELEKAKNQIITDQLRQRETSNGKALALGEATCQCADPCPSA